MIYAIIKNNIVENIIKMEKSQAKKLYPEAVAETDKTNVARIGARFNGEKFEPQQPYPSWVWDEETFDYHPPKPKPEGDYYWNEAEQDWLLIVKEVEQPEPEAEA